MKSKILAIWLCAMLVFSSAVVIIGNGAEAVKEIEKPIFSGIKPVTLNGGGSFGGGNGTIWAPYNITDVLDLQNMSANLSAHYVLANDIDATATVGWNAPAGFIPIGDSVTRFMGSLNGQNHSIYGLFINRPAQEYIALIGYADSSAEILNLGLLNVNITGLNFVGAIIGYQENSILGNCVVTGNITGESRVGGVVGGDTASSLFNCMADAIITATPNHNCGGIVGYNDGGNIQNCTAYGTLHGFGMYSGGIAGYSTNSGIVNNSRAYNKVTGTNYVGGVVGYNTLSSKVSNCSGSGIVSGSSFIGGAIGINDGATVSYSSASGNTSGTSEVGGLVGYNTGSVSNCSASGKISGGLSDIGGFMGYNSGVVTRCDATGLVSGFGMVGGFVGYNCAGANISCSYSTGNVSGTSNYLGGFAGYNTGAGTTITNCYALGKVTGGNQVGGFLGHNDAGTVSYCYSSGNVTGTNVGGFTSGTTGPMIGAFWDMNASNTAVTGGGWGLTHAEMMNRTVFTDASWDFATVWDIKWNYTYPFFIWNQFNLAPIANIDFYATPEDTPLSVNVAAGVLINDIDPDGDSIISVWVSGPAFGVLALNNTGSFLYTPAANWFGTVNFTYKANDSFSDSNVAKVSINVTGVNDAPTGADHTATIIEDSTYSFNAADFGFSDVDAGDTLSAVRIDTLETAGTLRYLGADVTVPLVILAADIGNLAFTPASNANGVGYASFTFSVRDSTGTYDAVPNTMTFDVTALNDAPTDLSIDDANIAENAGVDAVVGNLATTDPDAVNTFTYALVAGTGADDNTAFNINVAELRASASLNYETKSSYTVRVRSTDQGGLWYEEVIIISVTDVNEAPTILTFDDATADENALYYVDYEAADPDAGATFTWYNMTNATWLTIDSVTGNLSGTPDNSDVGWYWVNVTVSDGLGLSDFSNFTLTVVNSNDVPTVSIPLVDQNPTEDVAFSYKFASGSFTDVDAGDVLTYSATLVGGGALPAWLTFTPATRIFSGTPTNSYVGTISVRVTATDLSLATVTDDFNIVVINVNDAPVLASIGNRNVNEEVNLRITATATDVDLPANTLTFTMDAGAPPGASFIAGVFSWTPSEAQGYGVYPVTIRVSDGIVDDFETFTITVNDVNVAPIAINDAVTVNEDTTANAIAVLANDHDHDVPANTLTIIAITQGAHGAVALTAGTITYTPAANYFGTDSFTYTINDGKGANDTATVIITVLNLNDNPTAADDTLTIPEDSGPVTVLVLANDIFTPDASEILNITAVTQGAHGTVVISTDGTRVTYESVANYYGTDTFTYTLSDGHGGTDTAVVTVMVTNVNDVPVIATTDVISTIGGGVYSVDYAATDIDADTLTWVLVSNADWLFINPATGLLNGTSVAGNFNVLIVVNDGNGGIARHSFTLTVVQKDSDSDGVPDTIDVFQNNANETIDTDDDGTGNNADTDDDGDGVLDAADDFPLNSAETIDTDGDGIGNNADADDDADGVLDVDDPEPLSFAVTGNEYEPGWPYFYVLLLLGIVALIGLLGLAIVWLAVRKT